VRSFVRSFVRASSRVVAPIVTDAASRAPRPPAHATTFSRASCHATPPARASADRAPRGATRAQPTMSRSRARVAVGIRRRVALCARIESLTDRNDDVSRDGARARDARERVDARRAESRRRGARRASQVRQSRGCEIHAR
jgi:hypothetical protein